MLYDLQSQPSIVVFNLTPRDMDKKTYQTIRKKRKEGKERLGRERPSSFGWGFWFASLFHSL